MLGSCTYACTLYSPPAIAFSVAATTCIALLRRATSAKRRLLGHTVNMQELGPTLECIGSRPHLYVKTLCDSQRGVSRHLLDIAEVRGALSASERALMTSSFHPLVAESSLLRVLTTVDMSQLCSKAAHFVVDCAEFIFVSAVVSTEQCLLPSHSLQVCPCFGTSSM